jgi:hypothetical protein
MSTFGANDALYGTGTYGTARYGRVTPVVSISGVVGTGSIGTVEVKLDTTLTGVSATGIVNDVEEQPTENLESVSATGSVGTATPSADSSLTLTGVEGTSALGIVEAQIDTSISGLGSTGSVGTVTATASAAVMGAFNPDITPLLFSKVAFVTASEISADTRIAAVEGASLAEQNLASSRVIAQVLDATGSSGTTNETLAFTGGSQVSGSIQGAVGSGQAGALSTSATVFDFEAVKSLYSRRRTIFIARAA